MAEYRPARLALAQEIARQRPLKGMTLPPSKETLVSEYSNRSIHKDTLQLKPDEQAVVTTGWLLVVVGGSLHLADLESIKKGGRVLLSRP
jgi:hypothetical protein